MTDTSRSLSVIAHYSPTLVICWLDFFFFFFSSLSSKWGHDFCRGIECSLEKLKRGLGPSMLRVT